MEAPVKLKKFINTAKLKSEPIIVTDRSRIMWIAGSRLDGRFAVTRETRRILLVELV
jgi:hypothetical protein